MIKLKDMKSSQGALRIRVTKKYLEDGKSITASAQEIGMHYATLRNFMMGATLSFKSIYLLQKWVDKGSSTEELLQPIYDKLDISQNMLRESIIDLIQADYNPDTKQDGNS